MANPISQQNGLNISLIYFVDLLVIRYQKHKRKHKYNYSDNLLLALKSSQRQNLFTTIALAAVRHRLRSTPGARESSNKGIARENKRTF